jgi:hypothetical protein
MHEIAGAVALFACALFAGAAAYVSLVEHPARVQAGQPTALAEFVPSYRRASVMQASLAALATLGASPDGCWEAARSGSSAPSASSR